MGFRLCACGARAPRSEPKGGARATPAPIAHAHESPRARTRDEQK